MKSDISIKQSHKQWNTSIATCLLGAMLSACVGGNPGADDGRFAGTDEETGATEPAASFPLSSDSATEDETRDGLELVTPRAPGALPIAALPPASDDDTLSPRAAAARHGTHHSRTWQQFVQRWQQHHAAGMRLVDIDVIANADGTQDFFGVWEPGTGGSALYRYTSLDAFLNRIETQRSQNSQLVDVEIVRVGNTTWYYGVWLGSGNADPLTQSSSWGAFQNLFNQRTAQGMRLVDVELSLENGLARYWGVWKAATGPAQHLLRSSSLSAFGDAYETARGNGQRLRDFAGVHYANASQEYVGVTEDAAGGFAYFVYTGWEDFRQQWATQAEAGRSLRDLEVIQRPAGGRYYIGTWGSGPADPIGRTDTRAMANRIQSQLGGKVVGFSYAIADQSQLAIAGANGLAQRAPDPVHPMTSTTPSTVASVTKHLTGVATLALLERNSVVPTTSIVDRLPAAWNPLNSVNGLSFEHLLTHTSGLNQLLSTTSVSGTGNDWDGLQVTMEQVGASPGAARQYKNANFALQRLLIPALRREVEGNSIPVVTEANVRQLYLDALDDIAFERLGIEDVSCVAPAGQIEALSYEFSNPAKAGKSWATTSSGCGGHAGLQLSAQQLATFLTGVRYSPHILSAASQQYMQDKLAGWNRARSVDGGTAYDHGGDYYSSNRETHTCVMRLPGGIDAAIIVNSDTPISPCTVLRSAFNDATP